MKKIYKYSFSRHTLSLTTIYLTIFLALGIGLYFLYEGGYLSAWFFSFIVALVALMSLSIPRRILVDDEGLHISVCSTSRSFIPKRSPPYGKSRSRNSEATCPISAVTDFSGSTDTIST